MPQNHLSRWSLFQKISFFTFNCCPSLTYVWVSFSPFQAAVKHLLMPNLLSGMRDCGLTKALPSVFQLSKAVSSLSTRWERIYRECRRVVHEGVTGPEERAPARSWPLSREASSDKVRSVCQPSWMSSWTCDESDVISALSHILPYFSEGNLEDVSQHYCPSFSFFLQMPMREIWHWAISKTIQKNPSVKPIYNNLTYKNKLRKLYFLENLLDAEIQEKIDEVKRKEKTAMLIHANLFGSQI